MLNAHLRSCKAMALFPLLFVSSLALSTNSALSDDYSLLDILGFSNDNSAFLFEEFGYEDGTGFAYATRHIISTKDGNYIGGSPVRYVDDTGDLNLRQARINLVERLNGFEEIKFDGSLGETLLLNPITELSASGHKVSFTTEFSASLIAGVYELSLREDKIEAPTTCTSFDDEFTRFTLYLAKDGEEMKEVFQQVDGFGSCPLGHRIGGVHISKAAGSESKIAVLIISAFPAYEGSSYRYSAVILDID